MFHPRLRAFNFAMRAVAQGPPMAIAVLRVCLALRRTTRPLRWSSGALCVHPVVASVLTPGRDPDCARRPGRAWPHLATRAGIVHLKIFGSCAA